MPSLSWREGERRLLQNDASWSQTRLTSTKEKKAETWWPLIIVSDGTSTFLAGMLGPDVLVKVRRSGLQLSESLASLGAAGGLGQLSVVTLVLKRRTRVKCSRMSVFDTQRTRFPEGRVNGLRFCCVRAARSACLGLSGFTLTH